MNLAAGEFILSMDCDMRLAPDWLEKSVLDVKKQEVGVIGVSVLCDGGDDLVSRYMCLFGHQMLPDGKADFLSGNVWLMRRNVWEEVGGFGDYKARTHEDHQYCGRVKAAGYNLMSFADRPGTQVRSLSRHDMVRRFASWFRDNMVKHVRKNPTPEILRSSIYTVFISMFDHIEVILKERHDPAFLYFELLSFAYYARLIFEEAGGEKPETKWEDWLKDENRAWRAALSALLTDYPLLLDVLNHDLKIMGWKYPEPERANEEIFAYWREFFGALAPLAGPGALFEDLDKNVVKLIVDQDQAPGRNFSFYSSL